MKHFLGDKFRETVNMFTPVPTSSQFLEKGVLTPEEFIAAGDQLVYKFPTWQWSSAPKERRMAFLPDDKQYLLTRNVPCTSRVRELDSKLGAGKPDDADGWALPGDDALFDEARGVGGSEIRVIGEDGEAAPAKPLVQLEEDCIQAAATGDVPDLGGLALDDMVEDDPAGYFVGEAADDLVVRTRTYDLSITYDKYYRTPRLWLFGYSESGQPLVPEQIYEDVLSAYVSKTVTIDTHPLTGVPTTSIHPCRHAEVMKKVIDEWVAQGLEPRHDLALFVFLKFISGVVPTINYDFTMDIEM